MLSSCDACERFTIGRQERERFVVWIEWYILRACLQFQCIHTTHTEYLLFLNNIAIVSFSPTGSNRVIDASAGNTCPAGTQALCGHPTRWRQWQTFAIISPYPPIVCVLSKHTQHQRISATSKWDRQPVNYPTKLIGFTFLHYLRSRFFCYHPYIGEL